MNQIPKMNLLFAFLMLLTLWNCSEDEGSTPDPDPEPEPEVVDFQFGADLSYVNQILDQGGIFQVEGQETNPYEIFADKGNQIVRLRLWHTPTWTQEVYGEDGTQMYNDLADVERAIVASKAAGMQVLLDFHYSDTWADPEKQYVPEAWADITDIAVLEDSVYNYTHKTLTYLNDKGLMPEYVQLGNETNCGMMYSDAKAAFPNCNVCNDSWTNFRAVINKGILAVNDVEANATVDTQVILHVADPKNVDWWFDNLGLSGYDIIGFSYYPLWHTTIGLSQLEETVAGFKAKYRKDVMILETAYPWTTEGADGYNNLFGGEEALSGYPYTPTGQSDLLQSITQSMINAGGMGVIYWEPAWISSEMKDLWGTGSAWENNAFFDYDGNANAGFDYMTATYEGQE
ncbi:glycoside hydrolase family 53 protein [Reichenbachiella agariperforans]|uniref:glycoside hydrolase family 53 protein n=1 Tax=Reichenbachiella agariperforans TaxID=156994 RepID=UPI0020917E81|nr:glycosyl hydrolase 53 family protein [Reichenbachiella agariperforans]